jgi:hypothetical protein
LPNGRHRAVLSLFQDAPGAAGTPISITLNVRYLPTPMVTAAPIAPPIGTPTPTVTPPIVTPTPAATGSVTPTPTPTEDIFGAADAQLYLPLAPRQ